MAALDGLLNELKGRLPVEDRRVHLLGFSSGARLALRAAAARPGRYASVVAHSTLMPVPPPTTKMPPQIWVHGERDRLSDIGPVRRAVAAALKARQRVQLISVPGLGHQWAREADVNSQLWTFMALQTWAARTDQALGIVGAMHADMPLIATLAAAFGLALALGLVAVKLRLPALVGYLLAGVVIGPHTPGFVGDVNLAQQLAEVGVMLLMFGVGLHFSLTDLLGVRRVALPGALVQMGAATAMGAALACPGAGAWLGPWCLACRCRWPARWCCCAPSKAANCCTAATAASPWVGWWSKT